MPRYRPGDPKVFCAVCGFVVHRSETRKRWDGVIVCRDDWEPKHPALLPRPRIRDVYTVRDARPEPADRFIDDTQQWEDHSLYWNTTCEKWEDMDDNTISTAPILESTFNVDDTLGQ